LLECWSLLAAMASGTSRMEIGPLVACDPFRNPDLTAHMAWTVDALSAGRLTLGIGAGWHQAEFEEYGYQFSRLGERLRRLEGSLVRIRRRLERLGGEFGRKVPIMVGGNGERVTLALVAKHADAWNGVCSPADFARLNRVLDERCEAIGRAPGEVERSVVVYPQHIPAAEEYVAAGAQHLILQIAPPFDLDPALALKAGL
jgi:alkanesulfonate monooxygenase SsuD/methylene tetrahydromethanopterin reductase-like flavin-dependent oxidoreductase (luciferase family)